MHNTIKTSVHFKVQDSTHESPVKFTRSAAVISDNMSGSEEKLVVLS